MKILEATTLISMTRDNSVTWEKRHISELQGHLYTDPAVGSAAVSRLLEYVADPALRAPATNPNFLASGSMFHCFAEGETAFKSEYDLWSGTPPRDADRFIGLRALRANISLGIGFERWNASYASPDVRWKMPALHAAFVSSTRENGTHQDSMSSPTVWAMSYEQGSPADFTGETDESRQARQRIYDAAAALTGALPGDIRYDDVGGNLLIQENDSTTTYVKLDVQASTLHPWVDV